MLGEISVKQALSYMSAMEIEEIANKRAEKEALIERNRPRISPSVSLEAKFS